MALGGLSTASPLLSSLKAKVRAELIKHNGITKHPSCLAAITELAKHNPTPEPARQLPLLEGDWIAISGPDFPNRIPTQDEEDFRFTLGRISFNMFEPGKLQCSLGYVSNPVRQIGIDRLTYDITVPLVLHAPNGHDLPATQKVEATCYPKTDDRIGVKFTAATLAPASETLSNQKLMSVWKDTFANAYEDANKERSTISKLGRWIIFSMMNITAPSDAYEEGLKTDHSFRFEMKRSPVGYLDVWYLDEEMRITRGNRGSVVVVERATKRAQP